MSVGHLCFFSCKLQFFITTAATPWLNGKHVVFGKVQGAQPWTSLSSDLYALLKWGVLLQVLEGFDLVQQLQYLEVDFFSKPKERLKIADCGGLA